LEQNYPNPFNPTTNIKFEIAETSDVTLNVYNVMGQRVATLVNEVKAPGTYEIAWDAQEMASGIYYYRLRAGGVVFNRQMTLIK
ncbi:MAG: T9SS type A sorting domain-containing protein, partial [Bacteroidetes bacterium]|nr:T9SS type A sorting domain-containing protein [Bacteroidota bacterium]